MTGRTCCKKHSGLCRTLRARAASLLLSFAMVLSMCGGAGILGTTAYAVTGSTVAADGTYSGSSSDGTVYVSVSGGKITSVTASVKDKYQSYITDAFKSVIGKAATYETIDAVSTSTNQNS